MGIILRRVNLQGVSYCAESLMTPGSQQPFLKTLAQPFKGTGSQNQLWIHNLLLKRAKIFIFEKVLGANIFWTPRGMIPWGVSFFEPKSRITQ